MVEWNHSMCEGCWNKSNPNRQACTVIDAEVEICCFCGDETTSGIYIRHDPNDLSCDHDGHDQ